MPRPDNLAKASPAVALLHCPDYGEPDLKLNVFRVMDAAAIAATPGMRVLVKPNLLQARKLACASAEVTGAVCQWLLERGAKVEVADSPGFGRAGAVARAIGLEAALKPFGLAVKPLDRPVPVSLPLLGAHAVPCSFMVSARALESDLIISIPRVKAHSQMCVTLSVKNCFGCVPGIRKAFVHARHAENADFFADRIAALWAALPPVAAVADGIAAMHVTGPGKGQPYALKLLGASSSAPALDKAIMRATGVAPELAPVARALARRALAGDLKADPMPVYPLERPEDFSAPGFEIPARLKPASFNPLRLMRSAVKRLWAARSG